MKKSSFLVPGFALFAMFFGAGNLIFPPYLGMTGGKQWVTGFLCFILVEVVLSCVGIYSMISGGGSIHAMRDSVGAKPGLILNTAAILCTGVFIAPPRTAATTFEMAILPLTDKLDLLPFSILFFAVVFALTIRPTHIVDIIGKFLTPVLIVGIFGLILVGIIHPIGPIAPASSAHIAQDGIIAGYQAMDIISVAGFSIVVQDNLMKRGYQTKKDLLKGTIGTSCVAALLLALIYGGLTYLGATASALMSHKLNQTQLIVAITNQLLGRAGVIVLGVVVGFACLTTSVGLFGATASYFERITHGRLPYKVSIVILSIIGIAICNLGLSTIIAAATPVLSILCPPFMTTVVLFLFHNRIKNTRLYKGAAIGAVAASVAITLYSYTGALSFVTCLPLYDFGFGWLLPTVIGGVIGALWKKNRSVCPGDS